MGGMNTEFVYRACWRKYVTATEPLSAGQNNFVSSFGSYLSSLTITPTRSVACWCLTNNEQARLQLTRKSSIDEKKATICTHLGATKRLHSRNFRQIFSRPSAPSKSTLNQVLAHQKGHARARQYHA